MIFEFSIFGIIALIGIGFFIGLYIGYHIGKSE